METHGRTIINHVPLQRGSMMDGRVLVGVATTVQTHNLIGVDLNIPLRQINCSLIQVVSNGADTHVEHV